MRKIIGFVFVLIFGLLIGVPLWVFKGYLPPPEGKNSAQLQVRVLDVETGKVLNMPVEEYLVGVVAAEMPAEFELEALKAQAVAARTYTIKRLFRYGAAPSDAHQSAEVCNNPTHCQAWIDKDEMIRRWGKLKYLVYQKKIRQAVDGTKDMIITYNKSIIEPVYHGSCGGLGTENSEDVWSNVIPYLRGVDCPKEYKVNEQVYQVTVDAKRLMDFMSNTEIKSTNKEIKTTDIKVIERSAHGRIKSLELLGYRLSGARFRESLGLTSTYFTWKVAGDRVIFQSTGKGHAVGMCQSGANGMALNGADYRKILTHYYSGVQIQKIK